MKKAFSLAQEDNHGEHNDRSKFIDHRARSERVLRRPGAKRCQCLLRARRGGESNGRERVRLPFRFKPCSTTDPEDCVLRIVARRQARTSSVNSVSLASSFHELWSRSGVLHAHR